MDMNDRNMLNVIIAEDSIFFADITIRILKRDGLNVSCTVVSNGTAFRTKLREGSWNVILSDNVMPGFSALGALAVRNELCSDTIFVIVSEDINERDLETAFENGCSAYLPKERITDLPGLIKKLLKANEL